MSDNSNFNDGFTDDSYWNNLFEMAEDFRENLSDEEDVSFCQNAPAVSKEYHSPEEVLKTLFGYDSFREGQKPVIDSILAGRDTFAVMPTGAGKSVCYQIPAMLLSGITLVISPLISLMQDQVKALNEVGIPAAFINSSLSEREFTDTIRNARQGRYKIIYAAPERLMTEGFLALAESIQISMVTVDEAHCISQWGQDFRPSYMKIVAFVKMLAQRPIISAFTATATEKVREDIICTLGLQNPYAMVTGFDRQNLFFEVEKPQNKDRYILDYVSKNQGKSGIIYCATRKNVDKLYDLLKNNGIAAARYHAGMEPDERKKMQDDFVFDYTGIIVATNAFGMGIDKSNVRFVIHYNMPQSMENYYQEAGRAGRDGLEAKCTLLFSAQDMVINKFLLDHKTMTDLDLESQEIVKERDIQRLRIMENYCYTTECLRNYILKYFGEKPEAPCEDCGNCLREFETLDMTEAAKKIINCVYEARGRYGRRIIIDTVNGAQTARLEEIGAINYKSYGALSGIKKNLLERLIEQMIQEGYLLTGDYRVLQLGDISALKKPERKVLVKITDEDKALEKPVKTKEKTKTVTALTSAEQKLFERLRELRLDIAREEHVPPYIIFSDKTLVDMAAKVPVSREEMLNVSGVGENKFAKYGKQFLDRIEACTEENPELIQNKIQNRMEPDPCEEPEIKTRKRKRPVKQDFFLLPEEADQFQYAAFLYVSEIRNEMNRICQRENVKKLQITQLTEYLINKGLIVETEKEGDRRKEPTEAGKKSGIKLIDKVSERGLEYTVVVYPVNVQRMLVEHFIREEMENTEESGIAGLDEKREE